MSEVRIVVVDDFKDWRQQECSILETIPGLRVVGEAEDGLDALAKVSQLLPDIVLLDIEMPLLNGIEAAPLIRRISPRSRIIFLTQEHDSDVRAAALATGAEAYVMKSSALAELRLAIDAALPSVHTHSLQDSRPVRNSHSEGFLVVNCTNT